MNCVCSAKYACVLCIEIKTATKVAVFCRGALGGFLLYGVDCQRICRLSSVGRARVS